jgi:hypothetical protein
MSTPIPEGSVIITPTQVYQEMQATHTAVQTVITKLDTFVGTQADHESRLRVVEAAIPDNLDKRLSKIEVRQAMYSAAAAVAGTGIGWAIEYALYHH